eukprot:16447526-Heterocapsa_arctica.AAC.2
MIVEVGEAPMFASTVPVEAEHVVPHVLLPPDPREARGGYGFAGVDGRSHLENCAPEARRRRAVGVGLSA